MACGRCLGDSGERARASYFQVAARIVSLAAFAGPGCADAFWGGAPQAGPPSAPRSVRPAIGPWFVDRARDFGLDVVTRCGSPEKRSVLDSIGTGVALFDCDGDGDLDLFVAAGSAVRDGAVTSAGGPWLFRNDGPGLWVDVSARSGLVHTGWAQGAAVADHDADGDLDLFLAQHGPDTLWQNRGDGTFCDVTAAAGLADSEWGVSAAWGDADGDGWPDLYVTNYLSVDPHHPPDPIRYYGDDIEVFRGPERLSGEPDRLWRNRGDGTFEDMTAAAGLLSPNGKGMGVVFTDLDLDGVADLFVTNDTHANELFRGLGGGRFLEEGHVAGLAASDEGKYEGSMGIDVADIDGDGRLDVAYTNFHDEGTRILRNVGGRTYQDISRCAGVTSLTTRRVGWGMVLADFDGDGWPDLFQANGHVYPSGPVDRYDQPPLFLRNRGTEQFEDVTAAWGPALDDLRSGRAVASGDLDGDGDLDLVMTTIDGPLRVLINEGRPDGHSVAVRLVGSPPNREALGAIVELVAGFRLRVDVVRRSGSMLAASDAALHFGLGSAGSIDSLRVAWPDGTTSSYPVAGLKVNSTLTIRQDSPIPSVEPFATFPIP